MKEQEESSKKHLILQTTLELIQEAGLKGLTIRKISSRAGINVALIHYYFGSKENLIHETFFYILHSGEKLRDVFEKVDLTGEERLRCFFRLYMEVLEQYPDLVLRMFQVHERDISEIFHENILNKILADLQTVTGEERRDILLAMFMQTLGALTVSASMESFFPESSFQLDQEDLLDLFFQRYFSIPKTVD